MLRAATQVLCTWQNTQTLNGEPMHDHEPDPTDLQLVTLVDAARYLAVSRSALYELLTTGQIASVHIGRARRIPRAELQRFVRQRLSA
jgi:excisionase family DNA binding protein